MFKLLFKGRYIPVQLKATIKNVEDLTVEELMDYFSNFLIAIGFQKKSINTFFIERASTISQKELESE